MRYSLNVTKADPSGNITLIVESNLPQCKYKQAASVLLSMSEFSAEQVGFITEPRIGGLGRLEMSGGKFCGNASRAFGMYLANQFDFAKAVIPIEISGYSHLVDTYIDLAHSTAFAVMPPPLSVEYIILPSPFGKCPLIRFEGIWHIIARNKSPESADFHIARDFIYSFYDPKAFGIMYTSDNYKIITPVVYVKETGTIYHEGSCGSGSTAIAAFICQMYGITEIILQHPAGELVVRRKEENGILRYLMGGNIRIDEPVIVPIEL